MYPTNLDEFINLLNADPRLSHSSKAIAQKINSAIENVEEVSDPISRPSAVKEQEFLAKVREQLSATEVQLFSEETTTEAREDVLAGLMRGKLDAAVGDVKSEVLAVIMELRQLREQYERLGGTMGDPNFAQATGTYTLSVKKRWVELNNGNVDVTDAYISSIIFN